MIVFIGAGVSKIFGIPDTKGFIEIFNNTTTISKSKIFSDIKNSFRIEVDLEVLMTILEDLSKNQEDLYRSISPQTVDFLFRNISNRNHYVTSQAIKDESAHVVENVKNIIKSECFKAEAEGRKTILEVYDKFFNNLSEALNRTTNTYKSGDNEISYPANLKIFTTNYDRCIETYFRERQIPYSAGFIERFGCLHFDVSSYKDKENIVGLFKLHGTIDLFNINGEIRQRMFGETTGEEIIYYPIEFSGYRHVIESPYLELFYLFRERTSSDLSKKWLIAGSSLRDRTICSIMNDVIRLKREAERPQVIFVNPDKNAIERLQYWGFPHLVNKIIHVPTLFSSEETRVSLYSLLQ